jgi:hypothetical protein
MEAKDMPSAVLRADLDAALKRARRPGLRLAEVERRLGMDSTDSATPSSKERAARGAQLFSRRGARKAAQRGAVADLGRIEADDVEPEPDLGAGTASIWPEALGRRSCPARRG